MIFFLNPQTSYLGISDDGQRGAGESGLAPGAGRAARGGRAGLAPRAAGQVARPLI